MEIYETTDADFEKLKEFMELVDSEFVPPLSSRPGGIKGRISGNLATEDANYLIAEIEGRIAGVIGYRKNWNGNGESYISFIAVHPCNKQMGYHVFRFLKDDRGPGVDTIYFKKAIEC
jgi:hypothetical protein